MLKSLDYEGTSIDIINYTKTLNKYHLIKVSTGVLVFHWTSYMYKPAFFWLKYIVFILQLVVTQSCLN